MNDLNKDILVSGLFVTGLFGFVSGAYIVSSTVLAAATIFNSIGSLSKQKNEVVSNSSL